MSPSHRDLIGPDRELRPHAGFPAARQSNSRGAPCVYVLHMDHGGGNLSTFTGKAVASGYGDLKPWCGDGRLSGPLHGRANQDCLEFVKTVGSSDLDDVERFVRDTLNSGGKILALVTPLSARKTPAQQSSMPSESRSAATTSCSRRSSATRSRCACSRVPKIKLHPNVDAVSGSLLNASGLTDSNYYTVLFGLSRLSGIAAQIVDERTRFRGGKGVPIYRPKFIAEDQDPR